MTRHHSAGTPHVAQHIALALSSFEIVFIKYSILFIFLTDLSRNLERYAHCIQSLDMLMRWVDSQTIVSYHIYPGVSWQTLWTLCLLLTLCVSRGVPGASHITSLKHETEELFYHGFENYMKHAFPEDELRPITCRPLTRDRLNPAHIEVNDALGNYSLTLIDSLSTLAILASSPSNKKRNKPLALFQNAVKDVVEQYGDGTEGARGLGKRARGFDLDSKVQVFETAIRGLGGLLSAHLFAVGELPIRGYNPPKDQLDAAREWNKHGHSKDSGIKWRNGMIYDGQLLRLAHDLGQRLLPAFWTSTGIPYPRVNLRYGAPFYANSPDNFDPALGQCLSQEKSSSAEITETCSAGAGSLVLEFTVLSRLTGDGRFEDLAKRAFWAIWNRRSEIDLVGAGIDAETGAWQHAWTGIGAGIDSFFEYAYKSHVLLSGASTVQTQNDSYARDPRQLHAPLTDYEQSSDAFLHAFQSAHAAIKRHIYRGPNFQHPHYIQVDITTGAARAFWVDALSAYYPGLLTLSGHVEEAIETHLMSTALWTRFSALPERYNMATGGIEGGLSWWIGRPEFVESTWYLYRATEDPWYIYVGEMALRDIKRRCWTECGWAGIQNVVTGEKIDRMESFFLGETAKYFFLLFDPGHPLNKLDAPIVFSTEGHPLIIPRHNTKHLRESSFGVNEQTCPARSPSLPFTISQIAARGDVYHAASLARLHQMPDQEQLQSIQIEYAIDHPSVLESGTLSPSNYTYYPWTLPVGLVPEHAISAVMPSHPTFDLTFPTMANLGSNQPPLQRVKEGILINSIAGIRLSMVQDVPKFSSELSTLVYRIQSINHIALGKDEKVFISRNMGQGFLNFADPLFTRKRDQTTLDLVVDISNVPSHEPTPLANASTGSPDIQIELPELAGAIDSSVKAALSAIMTQIQNLVKEGQNFMINSPSSVNPSQPQEQARHYIPAITAAGKGAAPLSDWPEVASHIGPAPPNLNTQQNTVELLKDPPWTTIYAAGDLCNNRLAASIPRSHEIILVKRGNCSFSKKLSNIPSVAPSATSLQLVVIVDYEQPDGSTAADTLTRPLLDERQTTPNGLPRPNGIAMVMINGGESMYETIRNARRIGIRRRWTVSCQGIDIDNLIVV